MKFKGIIKVVTSVTLVLASLTGIPQMTFAKTEQETNQEVQESKRLLALCENYSQRDNLTCTSFAVQLLKDFEKNVPNVNTAQELYESSKQISREDLKAGDLVFFTKTYASKNTVTHVAIYIGDGMLAEYGEHLQYTNLSIYESLSRTTPVVYNYGRLLY